MSEFLAAMFTFTDPLIFTASILSGVLFGWLILGRMIPQGSAAVLGSLIAGSGVVFFVDQGLVRLVTNQSTWPRSFGTAVAWTVYAVVIALAYRFGRLRA